MKIILGILISLTLIAGCTTLQPNANANIVESFTSCSVEGPIQNSLDWISEKEFEATVYFSSSACAKYEVGSVSLLEVDNDGNGPIFEMVIELKDVSPAGQPCIKCLATTKLKVRGSASGGYIAYVVFNADEKQVATFKR